MKENFSTQIALWHQFIETKNAEILHEILADDVKFHSPFVWKPKHGKMMAAAILTTVTEVFEDFQYIREIFDKNLTCLEFAARIGEFNLRGVDLIEFNEDGKIIDFEVMIRPANALGKLGAEMTKRLTEKGYL
ncbi:MAG: nuclear transport factor 2 family protein [Acidobacteriota bacterium]